MKSTPFQSLNGRPYKGRIGFGQTVYGLDPRVSKYRPAWKKGIWLDKDDSDMDVIALDSTTIIKVKTVRKTSQWSVNMILATEAGPSDFFGRQGKLRIKAQVQVLHFLLMKKLKQFAPMFLQMMSQMVRNKG